VAEVGDDLLHHHHQMAFSVSFYCIAWRLGSASHSYRPAGESINPSTPVPEKLSKSVCIAANLSNC
jgi:hypothetical protein